MVQLKLKNLVRIIVVRPGVIHYFRLFFNFFPKITFFNFFICLKTVYYAFFLKLAKRPKRIKFKHLRWKFLYHALPTELNDFFCIKGCSLLRLSNKLVRWKKRKLRYSRLQWKKKKYYNFFRFYALRFHNIKKRTSFFNIKQRLFLAQKTITRTLNNFLYFSAFKKKNVLRFKKFIFTKDRVSTTFLNAYKPLIWKMRTARYVHWNLRTRGKLNEWRYHKLLNWELQKLVKVNAVKLFQLLLLNTYSVCLSWKQLIMLLRFNLVVLNNNMFYSHSYINVGDIIELPYSLTRVIKKSKKIRHFISKIKKLNYKKFLSRKNKKIKRYFTTPKIYTRMFTGGQKMGANYSYDPALNVFGVIYPVKTFNHNISLELTKSSVLTLQNWRYRFD